jgi:serine phosphatase RsbU (regulator of sigma subunit)
VPGWALTAHYEPAAGGRIGGDWYDAFRLPDGRLAVVLGDVAGHGISAAGTMAQLRNALRAHLSEDAEPAVAIERLNRFATLLLPGAFATVAVGLIDTTTGDVDAVIAGHPMPMLLSGGSQVRTADLVTSPPIGVPGAAYVATQTRVEVGETLVYFSDGLVERRDEDLSDGLIRLAGAVAELGNRVTAEALSRSIVRGSITDDVTVVVLGRPSG